MMKDCNYSRCDNEPIIVCNNCKFTPYCSEQCRIKDLPGHSLICSHNMSKRIFKYIDVLRANFTTCVISINSVIKLDGVYHHLNAFGFGVRCAICYDYTMYAGVEHQIKLYGNVTYFSCDACKNKKLELCSQTALDSRKCAEERALWSAKLMLLAFSDLDMMVDIMTYIRRICILLLKCTQQHTC